MKTIDLEKKSPAVAELLSLASKQNLLLKTAAGQEFVLAEVDDFAKEVARVRRNKDLMRLLAKRSSEKQTYTLAEMKKKSKLA